MKCFLKFTRVIVVMLMMTLVLSAEAGVDAYNQAVLKAEEKVLKFTEAVKAQDSQAIKRLTLDIQRDPAAIKQLNKKSNFIKNHFVKSTEKIHADTISKIKQKVAREYGVAPEDVRIKTFTNPSSNIKAGHDWDLTVSIKEKGEIPLRDSAGKKGAKSIVEESYFEAATGRKASQSTMRHFTEAQKVEITNRLHPEAYEGGKEFLQNPSNYPLKDPNRLSNTIGYKSDLDRNKAIELNTRGKSGAAEISKGEQARQYTKQYEKIIKPRIESKGGTIPPQIAKGTKILNKINKYDPQLGRIFTPEDADLALKNMGESIDSIIKKGSSLVEAADTLIPIKTGASKVNLSKKNYAGAVKKAGTQIVTSIAILNIAQDIKEAFQGKKSLKDLADIASFGSISTIEQMIQKNTDFDQMVALVQEAQKLENQAQVINMGLKLRKAGVSKEETMDIMEFMYMGDNDFLYDKLHELHEQGIDITLDPPKQVDLIEADDTYSDRAYEVFSGLIKAIAYDMPKRALKFVTEMGEDVYLIGSGLTDKEVLYELLLQRFENTKKALEDVQHFFDTETTKDVPTPTRQAGTDILDDNTTQNIHVIPDKSDSNISLDIIDKNITFVPPADINITPPASDRDGDGSSDDVDECPDDPNKSEVGHCGCFRDETPDSDHDGVYDCNDICKDNPNKIESGMCGCDQADEDLNGNGVYDCLEEDENPIDENVYGGLVVSGGPTVISLRGAARFKGTDHGGRVYENVKWISTDESVLTINQSGTASPHHTGTATIMAKLSDGASAYISVTVVECLKNSQCRSHVCKHQRCTIALCESDHDCPIGSTCDLNGHCGSTGSGYNDKVWGDRENSREQGIKDRYAQSNQGQFGDRDESRYGSGDAQQTLDDRLAELSSGSYSSHDSTASQSSNINNATQNSGSRTYQTSSSATTTSSSYSTKPPKPSPIKSSTSTSLTLPASYSGTATFINSCQRTVTYPISLNLKYDYFDPNDPRKYSSLVIAKCGFVLYKDKKTKCYLSKKGSTTYRGYFRKDRMTLEIQSLGIWNKPFSSSSINITVSSKNSKQTSSMRLNLKRSR